MFMLLIFMFIRTKKHTRMSSTHLLDVFVRDGAWAFALIFGVLSVIQCLYPLIPLIQ